MYKKIAIGLMLMAFPMVANAEMSEKMGPIIVIKDWHNPNDRFNVEMLVKAKAQSEADKICRQKGWDKSMFWYKIYLKTYNYGGGLRSEYKLEFQCKRT